MKSKRNRIVIDLNQPPPPGGFARRTRGRRSGRAGRVLALLGIILLVALVGIAAGGYFWWQHFKSGPTYALAVLVDASQRSDNQQVDNMLDMDKIADGFVGDVRAKLTGSSLLNNLLPAQVDQVVANITPKLKETLREALPAEIQRVSAPARDKPVFLIALSAWYLAHIERNGANAAVDLKFKDEEIQLTMSQTADAWRITRIKDDRLTNIIAGASQRGRQFQDELMQRLKDLRQTPSPSP
ncbi:MAG TPA: hypothetical protein VN696_12720 [Pyrinomonadaceae bacterium]|nr:hypothetical protein [Pyrinomonadaceae bacterium]